MIKETPTIITADL
jgi:hypothetical protein